MRNAPKAWAVVSIVSVVVACGGATSSGTTSGSDASTDDASSTDGGKADATGTGDARAPDGGVCVTVDAASYDRACTTDPECTTVTQGTLCTGGCACGNASIAARAKSRYDADTSNVKTLACPCAFPGTPRCVQNTCVLCTSGPNAPPGCPDAG